MSVILDYFTYGMEPAAREFLYDKIPMFLLIFAVVFLILMIAVSAVIHIDNVFIIATPSFVAAVAIAWFVTRAITPWGMQFHIVIASAIIPILMVALIVIMVAQILKFMW